MFSKIIFFSHFIYIHFKIHIIYSYFLFCSESSLSSNLSLSRCSVLCHNTDKVDWDPFLSCIFSTAISLMKKNKRKNKSKTIFNKEKNLLSKKFIKNTYFLILRENFLGLLLTENDMLMQVIIWKNWFGISLFLQNCLLYPRRIFMQIVNSFLQWL